ncbi:hypothetical protein F511_43056 [Dorcoceras hygrometricum]|uniref:Transmembrane protein n=1 Tax=Dorcoceras hygrometricum TaxID=472368 RepID=A0A2Z7A6A3_9LAMI|nr:hypothetical protein F511_43056 [Dorcoceras hygrometricum]
MWQPQLQLHRFHAATAFLLPLPFSRPPQFPSTPIKPNHHYPLCSAHETLLAQLSEELNAATTAETRVVAPPDEGPVELPPSVPSIFATSDDPTALQTATSVLLTGAITVFLFRSLRRRAQRAKETKFRSSGTTKSLKEEAVDKLKSMSLSPVTAKSPPTPIQAFLGALTAAVIATILYKFTTTIEASLNRQTLSDNYSVRQITITIRTIINGMCYLATFVFGANALGLFLYSGQLAFISFMEGDGDEGNEPLSSSVQQFEDAESSGKASSNEDQSSDNT